jgi:predicted CxxxxCH...CXXCH cytochrome family protein
MAEQGAFWRRFVPFFRLREMETSMKALKSECETNDSATAVRRISYGRRRLAFVFLAVILLFGPAAFSLAAVPDVAPTGAYIEAEDHTAMGAPNPWAWEVQNGQSGFQGTGYMYTTVGGTGTAANGSRIDFPVNFTAGGTYQLWLRARDASPSGNGDSTFWGIDGVVMGALTEASTGTWEWTSRLQNGVNQSNVTAGSHVINLWPRETGQHTDSIFIIRTDQALPGNVFEGSTAGVPTGHTALDFSAAGPGAGYITIPDGQMINGGPITLLDTTGGGTPTAQQLEYQTDLTSLQYRVLAGQSDGFPGFSLAGKWTKTDIGGDATVAPSVNDGTLTLTGAGTDIWGTRDYFSYLYQEGITGDFTIDVRVKTQQNTNAWAKAGIMVRQSLASNSRHAMVVVTPGNGVRIQYRPTDGATSQNPTAANATAAPQWLRLVRSGNTFTAYKSADGLSWTAVDGSASVTMTDPVYVGLAVTSHSSGVSSAVEFENFHVMPAATSGMSTTWGAVSGSIDVTGWSDGAYGLALNSGAVFETNVFDYSACVDGSPSSITIPVGQTVSGSSVSLSALFAHTGNAANFSYQINGASVSNPWNSFSVVPAGSSGPVTFHVSAVDPDCGGSLVSATETITVDNTCSDPTPSTLTIQTGQTTGGSAVDLTALVSQTGNVGALTYKINGGAVATPNAWDSTGYGLATPESVTLEVSGTDPDCSDVVTAINTIEIDNTCVRNAPSLSFDQDINFVGAGRAIPYKVTIRNEDSFNCGATTFNLAITADPVNSDFVASYFNPVGSNTGIVLQGRQSATIELAVEATAGATEWASKDTTLEVTSVEDPGGAHNTPKTTGTVTTNVFLVSPITHNSVTTGSSKWGGSWGTSETLAKAGIDSKYGNFDCLTCHEKGGPNVKWLKGEIRLPGANWGTGTTSEDLPIVFQDARDMLGDWGHDDPNGDGSGRTSSTRPCEVCHTITMYHRYDTNADPADPPEGPVGPQTITAGATHFPDRDCMDCHRHSLGFTASCIGCHGDPPLDASLGGPNGLADIPAATGSVTPGTHYKHVVVLGYDCEYCHAGWRNVGEMPKTETVSGLQQINHTFAVFGSAEPAATAGQYTGQDGVNYQPVADLQARGIQDANGTVQPGQGTMTCENIYCHGGTDNMGGINPQWNGNIHCNSCHGTSATNTPPGYSHTTHVGEMGLACTACHGTSPTPGSNGHVDGSVHVDLSELRSGYNSPSALYNGVGGTASGAAWDSGKLAPSDADVSDATDLYGTCSNVACHYGTTTPVWNNNNQPATCTICHNDGVDSGLLADAAPVTGAHADHMSGTMMAGAFIDLCQSCHGGGANSGKHAGHVNLSVDFASNLTWDGVNRTCTNTCHDGNYIANLWDSLDTLECDACHKSPYIGPTVVDPAGVGAGMAAGGYGSHLKQTKTEDLTLVTSWTTQCSKCHPYHSGGVTVPTPPANWTAAAGTSSPLNGSDMAQKLGLQFPITGGIHLGGTATTGGNEAEICWDCHGTDDTVNEWGYNADTNGSFPQTGIADINGQTQGSHNHGWLYTTGSWTTLTPYWVDASGNGMYRKDAYQHDAANSQMLSKRISSVHSVDFTAASTIGSSVANNIDANGIVDRANSQVLETRDMIRCSYCHDVHDQNRALLADGITPESTTGRPYLRGTWMGNPYAPDMPPLDSYSYPTTGGGEGYGNRYHSNRTNYTFPTAASVPRLYPSSSTNKGGYFIDQNSNWPTKNASYDTLEETAGICVTCHGSDVDNMDYYNGVDMWRPGQVNGHANAALGGSGAGHVNAKSIFDARRGATSGIFMAVQDAAPNTYSRWGKATFDSLQPKRDGPFRVFGGQPTDGSSDAPPKNTGWYGGTEGSTIQGGQYNAWYSASGIGTDGSSGAVRAHSFTCSKCHSPHASGLPALLITNCLDTKAGTWNGTGGSNYNIGPQATSAWGKRVANNCHRKQSWGTAAEQRDSGWHYLAPGQ